MPMCVHVDVGNLSVYLSKNVTITTTESIKPTRSVNNLKRKNIFFFHKIDEIK